MRASRTCSSQTGQRRRGPHDRIEPIAGVARTCSVVLPDAETLAAVHALGALAPDEAAAVEAAAAADPELRRVLDDGRDAAAALITALPVVAPDPAVRARLDDHLTADVRPGRFDAFATQLAALFDVTVDKARMFAGWIDDPARWVPSPVPHVRLVHLPGGPAFAGADCGLVRMPAGTRFPWHVHEGGQELTLVLQGRARYSDGREVGPGDELVAEPGSVHDFAAADGDEYVFAVRYIVIRAVPPP
jgi:quercetin dioxygenase-like cupin family protein